MFTLDAPKTTLKKQGATPSIRENNEKTYMTMTIGVKRLKSPPNRSSTSVLQKQAKTAKSGFST